MQNPIKGSGLEGLDERSALGGWHCFVNRAVDVQTLRPKYAPRNEQTDNNDGNGNFPYFHFLSSFNLRIRRWSGFKYLQSRRRPYARKPLSSTSPPEIPYNSSVRQPPPALQSG